MVVRFGDVEVDLDRIEIRVGGELRPVQPQVFDVIRYLLDHRQRVVTKEELLDNVWGDRFVSESTLTSRIKSARRALGDTGQEQAVIRTVHGRGYRFVAEPEPVDRPGGEEGEEARVGSSADRLEGSRSDSPSADVLRAGASEWPLVGRYAAVDAIVDLLEDPGLGGVLLVGPAGIGKTRLAVECMRRRAASGVATSLVTGSTAATGIPLAALAGLLPDEVMTLEGGELATAVVFRRSLAALELRAADVGRLLVMVDGADRLDELSAAVLAAAVEAGTVSIVATQRPTAGVRAFDEQIRAGRVRHVDVAPLDDVDVDVVLYRTLEGPIDLASIQRLSALSRGVPGLLRDLVESSQASGALVRDQGVWRLVGPVTSSASGDWPPDGLGAEARRAAELLALAGDLHIDDAEALLDGRALDQLDQAGLVALDHDDGEAVVRLADPLLAETVSAALGPVRSRRHKATLLEVLAQGRRRPRDVAAMVVWADELDHQLDVFDTLSAAQLALRNGDDDAAEVLVDHLDGGDEQAGTYALVIKGELCFRRAQYLEAERIFAEVAGAGLDPATAAFVIRRIAAIRYQVHADYEGSAVWLAEREAEAGADHRTADSLRAHRVAVLTLLGRADEALAVARPLLADQRGATGVEVRLACARASLLRGDLDRAMALIAEQEASPRGGLSGPEAAMAAEAALSIKLTAMLVAGELTAAEQVVATSSLAGARASRSWLPLSLAEVALEAGRPRAAREAIRPASEMCRAQGLENGRIACAAMHARTLADLGRTSDAERALAELWSDLDRIAGANRWYVADAMSRVAHRLGRGGECVDLLLDQASEAATYGARLSEANLLALAAVVDPGPSTAVAVADRVEAVAGRIGGRLWPIRAAHVVAVATGGSLEPVEAAYAAIGYTGFAALADDDATGRANAGPG